MTSTAPSGSITIDAAERYRSARSRGRALAELCRPQISRVPGIVMTVTAIAAGAGVRTVLAGWALIIAGCAIGATLNDRADVASDRVNGRADRPLANGALGAADVLAVLATASVVVAITQVVLPQPTAAVVTAAAAVIAWGSACEPLCLQRRGALGLLALGVAYLVLPVILVLGAPRFAGLAPVALLGAGVLAHKDVRDELGDRASGKRTLLVRAGYGRMSWTAVGLAGAGAAGCMVTIGTGWWFLPAATVIAALVWMARCGHSTAVWSLSRLALVVTAVLAGVDAAARL